MTVELVKESELISALNKIRDDQIRLEKIVDSLWNVAGSQVDPWFVDIHKAIAKVQDELLKIDRQLDLINRNIVKLGGTS